MISVLAFTLPGVPLIYSGDESGNNMQLESFSKLYQDVMTLRRNHPAFQYGSYVNVQNSANAHLFSFIRFSGQDSVLIVVNFANNKLDADIQMPAGASLLWSNQFTGASVTSNDSRLPVTVSPMSFLAFVPSSKKAMRCKLLLSTSGSAQKSTASISTSPPR
jgi:glycosidase